MISTFDLAALLLTLSAAFGWLNRRYIRLPNNIGLLTMGVGASLSLLLIDVVFPRAQLY